MDRRLDGYERAYWLLGRACVLNVAAVARVRGDVEPAQCRSVLDALQARHPLLGVHLDDASGPPRFVTEGTEALPLDARSVSTDDAWRPAMEDAINTRFPLGRAPLLRLVLLRRGPWTDACFVYHHAIGDAMAGYQLHQEFLTGLALGAKAVGGRLPEEESLVRRLARLPRPRGTKPPPRPRRGRHLAQDQEASPAQRTTRLVHLRLEADATAALAAHSKAAGTTVHAALCVAHLKALHPDRTEDSERPFALGTAVNLRPRFPEPPKSFGCYATPPPPTFHRVRAETGFWDLAREVKDALTQLQGSGRIERSLRLLDWGVPRRGSAADRFARSIARYSKDRVSITNLGRLEASLPPEAPALEAFHFAPTNNGGGHLALAVTTFGGKLALNVLVPEPAVSVERATRVGEQVVAGLRAVGRDEHDP